MSAMSVRECEHFMRAYNCLSRMALFAPPPKPPPTPLPFLVLVHIDEDDIRVNLLSDGTEVQHPSLSEMHLLCVCSTRTRKVVILISEQSQRACTPHHPTTWATRVIHPQHPQRQQLGQQGRFTHSTHKGKKLHMHTHTHTNTHLQLGPRCDRRELGPSHLAIPGTSPP